jgi:tRNA A37 methylthiotransferase MiaB
MPKQVPVQVARERNKILRNLAAKKKLAFMQSFLGKPLEGITLNVVQSGSDIEFTEALTDNFQKLRLRGRHKENQWITAHIEGIEDGALVGSVAVSAEPSLEIVS